MAPPPRRRKRALGCTFAACAALVVACSSGPGSSGTRAEPKAPSAIGVEGAGAPREAASPRAVVSAIVPDLATVPLARLGDPAEPVGPIRVVDNGVAPGAALERIGAKRLGMQLSHSSRGAISPDGALVVTDLEGEGWTSVDARSGARVQSKLAENAKDVVRDVRFSPDGKHLAIQVEGSPTRVRILDAGTGKIEHDVPTGKDYSVDEIVFAPDSSAVAFLVDRYDTPEQLVVIDVASGAVTKHEVTKRGEDSWRRIAIGPGAKFAALGRSTDNAVAIWDLTREKASSSWTMQNPVDRVLFDRKGEGLLGTSSGVVYRWRVPTGEAVFERRVGASAFLALGPDDSIWVLDYLDALIALDPDGAIVRRYRAEMLGAESIGFTPDGEVVAYSGYGLMTNHWVRATGQPVVYSASHGSNAETVQFSADGKRLFGTFRSELEVWDVAAGKLVAIEQGAGASLVAPKDAAPAVDWVAFESAMSAVGGRLGEVRVAASKTRALVWTSGKLLVMEPPSTKPILEVANATLPVAHLLADGSGVLVGGFDDPYRILDVPSGKVRVALEGGEPLPFEDAIASNDGKLVFGRRESATRISVYRTSDGKAIGEVATDAPEEYFTSIAASPDGKWLAVGCSDGIARVFAVATRKLVTTLEGHKEGLNAVAFSSDGATLATAGQDGTILLHPTASFGR
ncbi:MAG: WD40 repeat domain-containing protein [Polyangiaceae bacterium]